MSDSMETSAGAATKPTPESVEGVGSTTARASSVSEWVDSEKNTVLRFTRSMPGLDGHTAWQVLAAEDARPFLFLQSQSQSSLTLLVIEPRLVVENYSPVIAREVLSEFGFDDAAHHLLLSIVTVGSNGRSTMNLKAPIVVCPSSMKAVQVILESGDWPIHYPLYPDDTGEDPNE